MFELEGGKMTDDASQQRSGWGDDGGAEIPPQRRDDAAIADRSLAIIHVRRRGEFESGTDGRRIDGWESYPERAGFAPEDAPEELSWSDLGFEAAPCAD